MDSDDNKHSLIPLPDASLALATPEPKRVLSQMVGETLALARREPLFRIGEYEWCEPDYRQILLWAEALELEPEDVIRRMLDRESLYRDKRGMETELPTWQETVFKHGRMVKVNWDLDLLPLGSFTWVEELEIEYLRIVSDREFVNWRKENEEHFLAAQRVLWKQVENRYDKNYFHWCKWKAGSALAILHISLPKLRDLVCEGLRIETLDLSMVLSLETLECSNNRITQLPLTQTPSLRELRCARNKLLHIDVSKVPHIQMLDCSQNRRGLWPLSSIQIDDDLIELRVLDCSETSLAELDLWFTPNLEELYCHTTPIAELDIRPLREIKKLEYGNDDLDPRDFDPSEYPRHVRLLQRPDQNFT